MDSSFIFVKAILMLIFTSPGGRPKIDCPSWIFEDVLTSNLTK